MVYDLLTISTGDMAAIASAAVAICLLLGAIGSRVLSYERRVSRLEQAHRDAQTQHLLDITRIENKIDALHERLDTLYREKG